MGLTSQHIKIEGYKDSKEHLVDELKRLDLLIYKKLVAQQESGHASPIQQPFQGLVMSGDEALAILNRSGNKNDSEDELLADQYEQLSQYIYLMRNKSDKDERFLSFNYLQKTFQLSAFEEQCILICLASELDRKYEKLYAYLQDDMNYKYPTIDLVFNLVCENDSEKWEARKYFLKHEKLFNFIFEAPTEREGERGSFLNRRLKIRERIVHFLLEIELVHESFSEYSELYYPYKQIPPLLISTSTQEQLIHYVKSHQQESHEQASQLLFFIEGETGSGKTLHVKHFCQAFNRSLLMIDLKKVLKHETDFSKHLNQLYTEAVLQQSIVCFRNVHLLNDGEGTSTMNDEFLRKLAEFSGIVFLLSEKTPSTAFRTLLKDKLIKEIKLETPSIEERLILWKHFASIYSMERDVDYALLASMFEFTPGKIERSLLMAHQRAKWGNGQGELSQQNIVDACYRQVDHQLETKASRLKPKCKWDDLVLPEDLKELIYDACNQVKYRSVVMEQWGFGNKLSYGKGISMLFSGPPGTGKTMSAEVVANELGLEIYKVDLSQIISKYIGETEKNLKIVFEQAQLTNAILFFDETDALFGKRSAVNDAKDKYANIEVAYLLQKMEEHKGIIILATNLLENIDEAFLRRISFIISFPFPEPKQRKKIWRQMFPKQAPLNEDVDFSFLAEKLPLSGGNIKNVVLSASFLAAESNESICMKHLLKAAKHEMKKSGKILLKEDFDEYFYD